MYSDQQDEANAWAHTMCDTLKIYIYISKTIPATERVKSAQTPSTH